MHRTVDPTNMKVVEFKKYVDSRSFTEKELRQMWQSEVNGKRRDTVFQVLDREFERI